MKNHGIVGIYIDENVSSSVHLKKVGERMECVGLKHHHIESNQDYTSALMAAISESGCMSTPICIAVSDSLMPYVIMRFKRLPAKNGELVDYVKWQYQKQYLSKSKDEHPCSILKVEQLLSFRGDEYVGVVEMQNDVIQTINNVYKNHLPILSILPLSVYGMNYINKTTSADDLFVFSIISGDRIVIGYCKSGCILYNREIRLLNHEDIHSCIDRELTILGGYIREVFGSGFAVKIISHEIYLDVNNLQVAGADRIEHFRLGEAGSAIDKAFFFSYLVASSGYLANEYR